MTEIVVKIGTWFLDAYHIDKSSTGKIIEPIKNHGAFFTT